MIDPEIGLPRVPEAATRQPDIIDALLGLWRARMVLLVTGVAGLLLALIYVAQQQVLYTGQLMLTPSEGSSSGASSKLNSLASFAGLSSSGGGGSNFDLFLLELKSRHVATVIANDEPLLKELFAGRYDESRHRWRTSADNPPRFSLKRLLGLPELRWGRPSPAEVNDMIAGRIKIAPSADHSATTILFDDPDPDFAVRFISKVTRIADGLVRARTLTRSQEYIAYIQNKLRLVTLAEDREVLAAELGARERSAMLASSTLPFAADPLGPPTASTLPTWPRISLSVAIGLAAGLAVGLLTLLIIHVRARAMSARG